MTEQSHESEQGKEPASGRNAGSAPDQQTPPPPEAVSPEKQKANRRRKMLLGGAGAVVLASNDSRDFEAPEQVVELGK